MERTLIGELKSKTGQSATINGWVTVRRDQGKMVFFDFRDRSGAVQGVVLPKSSALEIAKETTVESAVSVTGLVNARPEKNITAGKQNGDIELVVEEMQILSKSQTLPFELSAEINLDTHLDNLPLTLKTERSRDIFTMQASIVEAFREAMVPAAIAILGEPNRSLSKGDEIKWNKRGSFSVNAAKGTWCDHEDGDQGGGVLDFLRTKLRLEKPEALAWLRDKKLIGSKIEKIVVLASGELTLKVTVVADRVTKGAREAILALGGTIQEPCQKTAE